LLNYLEIIFMILNKNKNFYDFFFLTNANHFNIYENLTSDDYECKYEDM